MRWATSTSCWEYCSVLLQTVVASPKAVAWTAALSDGSSVRIVSAVEGKTRVYSFGTGRCVS